MIDCNIQFATTETAALAALRTQGGIDTEQNIINKPKFDALNKAWSSDALEKYGLKGKVFFDFQNKATPNTRMLSEMDKIKNDPQDYKKITQSEALRSLEGFKLFEDKDKLCSQGICNMTAEKSTAKLKDVGLNPYPNNGNGSSLAVEVKSPAGPFNITHYVSAVVVEGKAYVYDMPQHEFLTAPAFGQGPLESTPYEPRLIPLDVDSIQAEYDITTEEAAKFVRSILNRKANNVVLMSFKEYLKRNVDNPVEYIANLEEQISKEGVTLDLYAEHDARAEEFREEENARIEAADAEIAKITAEDENKIINFFTNKLKEKVRQYLPKRADKFRLSTLIKHVIGIDFSYNPGKIEDTLADLGKQLESPEFVEKLKGDFMFEGERAKTIQDGIDLAFHYKNLLESFFKHAKVIGPLEARKKFSSSQQYELSLLLDKSIIEGREGKFSPEGVQGKRRTAKQSLFLSEKYFSNINNVIKKANINFGNPIDQQYKSKMMANAKRQKIKTVLQYLHSMEGNTAPLHEAISKEAHRRQEYFLAQGDVMYQMEDFGMSTASNVIIEKVKRVAEDMGISITTLQKYAQSNPSIDVSGANGVADLTRRTIAVAQGRENVALTEEVVHMATAMMEQTNPKLVTQMISKITGYEVYNRTLQAYKGKKAYQLEDGRPDIRKIKKEAVDKLITEVIINGSQDTDQFPELRQRTSRTMVEKWWNAIKDSIRAMYGKSKIDIFQTAADNIMNSEAGTVEDIRSQGVYEQEKTDNSAVSKMFETITGYNKRMELVNPDGPDRHYTLDGERVAASVTEKIKRGQTLPERSPKDKVLDDEKRDWGSEGHNFIQKYIEANLIDKETGFALEVPLEVSIDTGLSSEVEDKLIKFSKDLIGRYPAGTRFAVEPMVVNEKEKGMLGSAIDFVALEPVVNKDGTDGVAMDVLDWKFTAVDLTLSDDDIPWFKQESWKKQMGEYKRMLVQYGGKFNEVRKARMVPFIMNYQKVADLTQAEKEARGFKEDQIEYPHSMEVGDLDNLKETETYLLPVPVATESTGSPEIDRLVSALNEYYRNLKGKKIDTAEEKMEKIKILNPLFKAIRRLQVAKDFEPLAEIGETLVADLEMSLEKYKTVDFANTNTAESQAILGNLLEFKETAQKFLLMEDAFLADQRKSGTEMTEKEQQVLDSLAKTSVKTREALPEIDAHIGEYAMQLAVDEGFLKEADKHQVLDPEREVSNFSKTFLEASKISNTMIKLGTRIIERTKSMVEVVFAKKMKDYRQLVIDIEAVAKSRGVKAFSLIGKVTESSVSADGTVINGGLNLIQKLDKKFLASIDKAFEDKNKQHIIDNIDMKAYNEKVNVILDRQFKIIDETTFNIDPTVNDTMRVIKKATARKNYDINKKNFNGWNNGQVKKIIRESIKEEGNLSKDYMEMAKTPAALAMWEWYMNLNEKAMEMGYIGKQGMSFFPLMEATTLQKFAATKNIAAQSKDFFTDLYRGRIDEKKGYSRTDPTTGEVRKSVPKYFTVSDRKSEMLSQDLNMVGAMWQKALLDYENIKGIENTMLALYQVEKVKGRLILDENNDLVMEAGKAASTTDTNKNLDYFDTLLDDSLYGLSEEQGGLINKSISSVAKKTDKLRGKEDSDGVETEISLKKGFDNANILVRAFGVGLKPAIAIANWFGFQVQSFIMSGTNYTFLEFEKNNLKFTTSQLSLEERGLLHLLIPMNEDIVTEERRRTGKETGFLDRLKTWSFQDVMMSTNHFPERALQGANALSFFNNGMIRNGKIVNIVHYVRSQDRKALEGLSKSEMIAKRKEQRASFKSRVKAFKESESLAKVVEVTEDGVTLPGVSDAALADYKLKIQDYSRNLNGQMSSDNKANYRRNLLARGFMMFKTWIPKLMSVRLLDLQYNVNQGDWEYGRANLWFGQVAKFGVGTITRTRDILAGNEEGIRIMDEILQEKKASYYAKHGRELTITPEEFYDLVQREVANQMKELGTLVSMLTIVFAFKAAAPDDDATMAEKNRYKYWTKVLHKMQDEISFYYNPYTFDSITKSTPLPALSLIGKTGKIFNALGQEVYGHAIDDQKMVDDAKPLKYFLNMIPGAAQWQNSILPLYDPEAAKERGIIVTSQSRQKN